MAKYLSILTHRGEELIAAAIESGVKIDISHMAVGDGLGVLPNPHPDQTTLLRETYRAELNSLKLSNSDARAIIAEMIIPSEIGGFWIREFALFSSSGEMVAVGNVAESYKPVLEEGSGRLQVMRMPIIVSSTESVMMKLDPDVVLATTRYVDDKVAEAEAVALDAYELATDKATVKEIYPVGICVFFAENKDPNKQWPGTAWHYTGENKVIRLAKQDGSDILGMGGKDVASLAIENMPKHSHSVSGNVDEFDHGTKSTTAFDYGTKGTTAFDYGTKNTTEDGDHSHQAGIAAPGTAWQPDYIVGSDNDSRRPLSWTSTNGNHVHTVAIGAHGHDIAIGPHGHDVTIGKHSHSVSLSSDEVGGGKEFSIANSYIKLMCWYRSA
ncbi:phage tail protein [Serratia grimesii]|nr:phage tail protein [Serratia grimesii]